MTNKKKELARIQAGLTHIKRRGTTFDPKNIERLTLGEGSKSGCLNVLSMHTDAHSMFSFFGLNDLPAAKQWAACSAKIEIMQQHIKASSYLTESLLWPLISDCNDYIDWFRQHEFPYLVNPDTEDPKNWIFYRYQSWLALNQRWDELRERCERILFMEGQIKKDRSYLIDHRFYLALAKGNVSEMETVLREKLLSRNLRTRLGQQSGLTAPFIDSYAVVFAKLAWHNGYELDIDSPWIPRDWLPIRPLDNYHEPWDFMREFDIWQPLEGAAAPFSPKRNLTD